MPERITWSAVFILEASELIRSQCTYASRCGFGLKPICSVPDEARQIVRHVIHSAALPAPVLRRDDLGHDIQSEIRRQSSQRTGRCAFLLSL